MEQNKTGKYLKYAIGEIILVVIGILIALSINNWNEERKTNNLKQKLYIELRASIMSDTVSYNVGIADAKLALTSTEYLKEIISKDVPYTTAIDSSLERISWIRSREANYTILTRISDVGIEIIDNVDLKNEVLHYYEDSKTFVKIGNRAHELLKQIYPKYFVSRIIDETATPENFEELKTKNEFKVALDYCLLSSEDLIKRTTHRKVLAIKILQMLDDQITISKDKLDDTPYIKTMENLEPINRTE